MKLGIHHILLIKCVSFSFDTSVHNFSTNSIKVAYKSSRLNYDGEYTGEYTEYTGESL